MTRLCFLALPSSGRIRLRGVCVCVCVRRFLFGFIQLHDCLLSGQPFFSGGFGFSDGDAKVCVSVCVLFVGVCV